MKLRKEHLTIGLEEEEKFVKWYVHEFMPDHLPEYHEVFTTEDLVRMVRNGRKEAIARGFTDGPSQAHFVTLMWKLGPSFHRFPGFCEIADAKDQPGPERIERFYEVSDEQGAAAVLGADDRYWFPESYFPEQSG